MSITSGVQIRPQHSGGANLGFTLLEMVVAMLAASMLLVGLSSALYLTIQATEPDIGGHQSKLTADMALAELTGELRFAKTFLTRDAHAVEFTVADRDGDTNDETIRWEWSGTATDPLTRQYNAGSVVNVLENVYGFDLSYNIDEVTTVESGTGEITSDEFMLADFEGWAGISPTIGPYVLSDVNWAAEYFQAQGLPVDLTEMEITKISLRLADFLGGTIKVSIYKAIGGGSVLPEASPIGSPVFIDSTTLPSGTNWIDIAFSDVILTEYQDEFVIVISTLTANAAAVEYYNDRNAPSDSTVMIYSSDAGSSWDPAANKRDQNDMPFRAYGTYTTIGEGNVETTRYFVVSSGCQLQVGSDGAHACELDTEIVSRPEVVTP